MATPRALSRLHHDTRVLLLALGMAVPGAAVALVLTWTSLSSQASRWTLTALVLVCVFVGALALRAQVVRPLQLLTNLLSAVREGDLSLRVGALSRDDPLDDSRYDDWQGVYRPDSLLALRLGLEPEQGESRAVGS